MATFNDPHFTSQWQLLGGWGINIASLYDEYTGAGVTVGIIDTALDVRNKDLATQIDKAASKAAQNQTTVDDGDSGHGTGVALILAAAANNGYDRVGAAFGVTLVSYSVDSSNYRTVAQEIEMMARQEEVDVSNSSWSRSGTPFADNFNRADYDGALAALESAATEGRGGLGTIIIRSSGNNGASGDSVNTHNWANNRYSITVGATDENGEVQSFSNPGAALLAVAPATATSYAAPLASATAALMLQANPLLGYRDVQTILAMTAKLTDADSGEWFTNAGTGWNGGGLHISYSAGYGLIDAHAAVRLAESWTLQSTAANLVEATAASTIAAAIPDLGSLRQSVHISDQLSIERVEVAINIAHDKIGNLRITLVSPSGTQSVLLDRVSNGSYDAATNTLTFTLSSVQYLRESSQGDWQLLVEDLAAKNSGTLYDWSLTVIGSAPTEDTLYILTDEYATLAAGDATRRIITDSAGIDTINAAAVTTDSRINLAPGGSGRVGGQLLTMGSDTLIENAIGGDGNDTLRGNDAANYLAGWRGDDILRGVGGDDTLDGGAGGDDLDGGDGNDILHGGDGNDILYGGREDDILYGDDGEDALDGSLGNDLLYGGVGNDSLLGGMGDDRLDGGTGDDTLDGGAGDDLLYGEDGNDSLLGGVGNDLLDGGSGDDLLDGGAGNDRLYGGDGNDALTGGLGNDDLDGGNGEDTLNGGAGDDILYGAAGNDSLVGGAGNDLLDGGIGNDALDGGSGDDALYGADGNDRLIGGAGSDMLDGAAGDDTLDGSEGNDALHGGDGNDRLIGGTGNDTLEGDLGDDTLDGEDGNDSLNGGDGDDTLTGGTGNDLLEGGRGNDLLDGGAGNDTLYGGAHNDTLLGDAGNDIFYGEDGNDRLEGGTGNDTLYGGDGNDVLVGDDGNDVLEGGAGDDKLCGAAGDDTLSGGDGNDYLIASIGNDLLDGGSGDDTLDGGTGNDLLLGGAGADILSGSNGNDRLYGGAGDDNLDGGADNDLLYGEGGNDILSGSTGNDSLFGGVGDDQLDGGIGDDILRGEDGADTLIGGVGDDLLDGGAGNDSLDGGIGNDTLLGGDGNDLLLGGLGDDRLDGGTGHDRLDGGAGNDLLDGGLGADVMIGGDGDDIYVVDDSGDLVIEARNQGNDTVRAFIDHTLAEGVERLELMGNAALNGTGNSLANILIGNAAANILDGGAGSDTLDGGAGADTMIGGTGHDLYIVDDIGDVVIEGKAEGYDTVRSTVSFTLPDWVEQLELLGTEAIDGAGNSTANVISGNEAVNTLFGDGGADIIGGGGGNDVIDGGTGHDTITGGTGDDVLAGGSGMDSFIFNPGDGHDRITDFNPRQRDVILLNGFGAALDTWEDVQQHLAQASGGVLLDTGAGTTIMLDGLKLSALTADQFLFG